MRTERRAEGRMGTISTMVLQHLRACRHKRSTACGGMLHGGWCSVVNVEVFKNNYYMEIKMK